MVLSSQQQLVLFIMLVVWFKLLESIYFCSSTTSTSFVSMGSDFSLAITPKFNNSLILIDIHLNPYVAGSNNSGQYNVHNGTAQIGHATNGFGTCPTHGTGNGIYSHFTIHASDTVSSTATRTLSDIPSFR